MALKVGALISSEELWISLHETAEGECPVCGFEPPLGHHVEENEDGDMRGRCSECFAVFQVVRKE